MPTWGYLSDPQKLSATGLLGAALKSFTWAERRWVAHEYPRMRELALTEKGRRTRDMR